MSRQSVPTIGRSNKLISRFRRLSRSPADRAGEGAILVEGIRLAESALDEGIRLEAALVSPRLEREPRGRKLLSRLLDAGVSVRRATDALLGSLHDAESHQGVLLLADRASLAAADFNPSAAPEGTWLAACGVQDPGNMGALVRVADAASAEGLVAVRGADPFGPKAVRASAGSIFRLPVTILDRWADLADLARRVRDSGGVMAGAVATGGRDYAEIGIARPLLLVVGSEGAGLPEPVGRLVELPLTIPLAAGVESINVATAAAVLMFERRRQARAWPSRRAAE